MRKFGLAVLVVFAIGCGAPQPQSSAMGDLAADNTLLKEANAAASTAVQASGDCDRVKAAAPEALRKLDEILTRARTGTARTAIEALKKQVNDAVQPCP
jgi:hypothetical protein